MRASFYFPFPLATSIFDHLEDRWERPATRRWVANILVLAFILSLAAIELNRHQWFPVGLSSLIPVNHFYAIKLAFDLLLIIEVLGLVFSLASSVADAMGKQFEILSLILLRQSFKE